jgi:hypothetical protein
MSMSSRQCRGGGGSSSGASVSLISKPHTLHRYLTLTLRSSPAGGGGAIGVVKLRSRPMPLFHRTKASASPATSQMRVDRAGTTLRLPLRLEPSHAAIGSLAAIHRTTSAGSIRRSSISASIARIRESSLDAEMPKRSGLAAATAMHVLQARGCSALKC